MRIESSIGYTQGCGNIPPALGQNLPLCPGLVRQRQGGNDPRLADHFTKGAVYSLITCHMPPRPSPVASPAFLSPAKKYIGLPS